MEQEDDGRQIDETPPSPATDDADRPVGGDPVDPSAGDDARADGPATVGSRDLGDTAGPDTAEVGANVSVAADARVGLRYADDAGPAVVGDDATIRSGSVLYADTAVGADLTTGHRVLIREQTTLGEDVLVGTDTVIEDHCEIGSHVRLQTGVYLPSYTTVGDRVFVGPRATMTNDPYPVRQSADLEGPTLADDATVGANATLLPGVHVGERAFVAAGAVVTDDVPADTLAVGAPARHQPLPADLAGGNDIP
jgi:acetyltransferase-like isoleucine patch superfamily enzyme